VIESLKHAKPLRRRRKGETTFRLEETPQFQAMVLEGGKEKGPKENMAGGYSVKLLSSSLKDCRSPMP